MHHKPTAGCQISILIFQKKLWRGVSINIAYIIYQERQNSCPLWAYVKGITQVFKRLKCLGGLMHLKHTAGCQISILIFEKKNAEGGLYKYPLKNISRTAKFLPI